MKNPLTPFLNDKGYVLLDGALATELERGGADLNDPLWSAKVLIEAPESLEALYERYFRQGADVATSASYQATFEGFAARGIGEKEAARLLRLSVELTRRSAARLDRPCLTVASIGPYGAFLHDGSEYSGDYGLTRTELMDFHRKRLEVLVSAGPNLVAFETIPSRTEAEALVALLAEYPSVSAWLSFSCRNELEVCHGEPFRDSVALVADSPQIVAVGINCTPPDYVSGLLRSAHGVTKKPFAVYPNSGESWDAAQHRWLSGPDSVGLPALAPEWRGLGAKLIGGCCRTTPETIRDISMALSQRRTL